MEGYFPYFDCSSLRPICPTQDEPSCIELKDPDDLYLVNCNVLTYCWKINKSWTKNSCHFILNGLSINTYYSIIIVISCTLMINKVTQTRCSSMYFFLLTQYTALKVLFQQRRTRTSIFFFHCLDSEKRTFRACVISRWSTTIFLTCSTKMLVVFSNSFVHPRNTWTHLWLGMAQDVTIKSSSCQDSPDYFTCSYFFDGFLQEMREVRTIEFTETSGACWR